MSKITDNFKLFCQNFEMTAEQMAFFHGKNKLQYN